MAEAGPCGRPGRPFDWLWIDASGWIWADSHEAVATGVTEAAGERAGRNSIRVSSTLEADLKNQYFGDARDYFKYDVLDRLATDLPGIEVLTCIWMLTRPDSSGEGQVRFIPDEELPALTAFFNERLSPLRGGRRHVSEMADFFATRPYDFYSYRDDADDFGSATREAYFREIPEHILRRAVVFLDPDTGMQPEETLTPKHLRYDELKVVVDHMSDESVAVVFQYQRRVKNWVEKIGQQLADKCLPHVGYIWEPHLAFFLLAKSPSRLSEGLEILRGVAHRTTPGGRLPRGVATI